MPWATRAGTAAATGQKKTHHELGRCCCILPPSLLSPRPRRKLACRSVTQLPIPSGERKKETRHNTIIHYTTHGGVQCSITVVVRASVRACVRACRSVLSVNGSTTRFFFFFSFSFLSLLNPRVRSSQFYIFAIRNGHEEMSRK